MKNTDNKKSKVSLMLLFLKKFFGISIRSSSVKMQIFRLWFFYFASYIFGVLSATFYEKLFYGLEGFVNDEIHLAALIYALAGIAIQTIMSYIIRSRRNFWVLKAGNDIEDSLDSYLDRRFCDIPYSNYNDPAVYDSIAQLKNGVKGLFCNLVLTEKSMSFVGSAVSIIIALVILVRVNLTIAILVFLSEILAVLQRLYQAKHNYYRAVAEIPERRWCASYYSVLSNRKNIKEVRFLGITDYIFERWTSITRKMNHRTTRLSLKYTLQDVFHSLLSMLFQSAALILTVVMIVRGELGMSSFVLIYTLLGTLSGPAGNLIGFFADMNTVSEYMKKWLEFEQYPNEESVTDFETPSHMVEIVFNNVSFKYPGTEKQVLTDINMTIHRGERIAVVGANGSGKTTFVSLLNQLYQPTSGEILFNGILGKSCLPYVRHNSMTLFQNFPKYETNIRDNIAFGNIDRHMSDGELMECAQKSGFDKKLKTLEEKLDTPVGVYYPGGIELSGGEWQRLAIARAWTREDSELLIFDEPTAALDAFGESLVYKQILQLVSQKQIAIIVSHRLTITPYVDRILVFDNGKIVEDGNHNDLMNISDGVYRSLYHAQAELYR